MSQHADFKLVGPLYALLTPFNEEGDIDYHAFASYLEFLWNAGVRNALVNGSTGEFASLSITERKQTLEFCRQHWKGTLVNHVSACCVADVIDLIRHTEEPLGDSPKADAILVLPPFYFAGTLEAGLEEFLKQCIMASSLPAFLYHFPFHTQQPITPCMYSRLAAACPNLAGIKDSGGSLDVSLAFKEACPSLQVYVGNDRAASTILQKGLDGSVTGAGNAVPGSFVAIHNGFVSGDKQQMAQGQEILNKWAAAREAITPLEPPIIKAALSLQDLKFSTYVRAPFSALEQGSINKVAEFLVSNTGRQLRH